MKQFLTLLLVAIPFISFSQAGKRDGSFGNDGKVVGPAIVIPKGITIQQDGKILLGGSSGYDFALTRYLEDGAIDNSFFNSGTLLLDVSGSTDYCYAFAVQPDGKFLLGGEILMKGELKGILLRLNANGTYDYSFGDSGIVSTSGAVYAILVQPDNKIVIAGRGSSGGKIFIERLKAGGGKDKTFGADGVTKTDVIEKYQDYVSTALLQPDGKILVCGFSSSASDVSYGTLLRYNSNGLLDSSFNGNGIVLESGTGNGAAFHSIALQSNGFVVAAGDYLSDFAAWRYTGNGSPDLSFGNSGSMHINIKESSVNQAYAVAIQSDGKILLAGDENIGGRLNFAVLRLNENGLPDSTFRKDGMVTTNIEKFDHARLMQLQTDGKILVAGYGSSETEMVRYLNDTNPSDGNRWQLQSNSIAGELLVALDINPNPVSETAIIHFIIPGNLSAQQFCEVQLFDLQGRKIQTIAEGNFSAGNHLIEIRRENLDAGIYIMQLKTSEEIISKKLIVQ